MRKEKPILFKTEMVQAILAGKKTMTRRVFPLKHYPADNYGDLSRSVPEIRGKYQFLRLENGHEYGGPINCPYGKVGDILWVRETWAEWKGINCPCNYDCNCEKFMYKADPDTDFANDCESPEERVRWKPSIHMPRSAARLFLKVKDIRVERLQFMTDEDCEAEGVRPSIDGNAKDWREDENGWHRTFRQLWDSINPGGWDLNPWVWVVEFERVEEKQ